MKKILLPTDFSDNARNAINFALTVFGAEDASYILFHAVEVPSFTPDVMIKAEDVAREEGLEELQKEVNRVKDEFPDADFTFKLITEPGEPITGVDKVQHDTGADIIVMGSKGASGVAEVLMGSNTSGVIQTVSCPVLLVPYKADVVLPEKIVFATDQQEIHDPKILEPLKQLAEKFDAEVLLLNVVEPKEGPDLEKSLEREKLDDYFAGLKFSYHVVEAEKPAQGIDRFVRENKADLVAMIARRDSFFNRIFHKSVTNEVALHTEIPLLAMHDLS